MRRLIMWNLITLDGFFDGETPWDLAWHERAWCEELEELSLAQGRSAERLLFGRKTYQGMAAHLQTATGEIAEMMNTLPKTVFSTTLDRAEWANTELVRGDAAAAVARMKPEGDGDVYVFGSADLSESLERAGLFDEYRICVAPVILGKGRALFGRNLGNRNLRLLDATPVSSGAVVMRYVPSA